MPIAAAAWLLATIAAFASTSLAPSGGEPRFEPDPPPLDERIPRDATPSDRARRAVHDAVVAQLDRIGEGIFRHEASRSRHRLLERRMTVETFMLAGLAPQRVFFGRTPDLAAPWRYAFDGVGRPLEAVSTAAQAWTPLAHRSDGDPWDAVLGRFSISFARSVGGDDPVAIGGRVLARPDRVLLAATWCEPCLAPDSVDFPILPEGFLLEWDATWRTLRVRLPRRDVHHERTLLATDSPPRLDHPGDLYDLFDGLRALPWLVGDTPGTEPPSISVGAAVGVPSTRMPEEPSRRRPADPHADWISQRPGEAPSQRTTIESSPPDRLHLRVDQSPIDTQWTSFERYELVGDVLGDPLPPRSIRPEGTIVAHEGGTRLDFELLDHPSRALEEAVGDGAAAPHDIGRGSVHSPAPSAMSATADIETAGRHFASIHWSRLRLVDEATADRLEARFRHAFATDAPSRSMPGRADALATFDPAAAARRQMREELRRAIVDGPTEEVANRLDAHLDRIAADQLPVSIAVRSIEALEERLVAPRLDHEVEARLGLAWRRAVEHSSRDQLIDLLEDRIRQGRFFAARRLAHVLEEDRRDPTTETRVSEIRRRLDALREHAEPIAPSWFEPLGRLTLDLRGRHGAPLSAPDRTGPPEPNEVASAAVDDDADDDLKRNLIDLIDDAIAQSGTWPRPGARERLHAVVEHRLRDVAEGGSSTGWNDPLDRRRLGTALRLFIEERRHLLADHLRRRPDRGHPPSEPESDFARAFDGCIERVLRMGPTDESRRRAGEREENRMLAASLRCGLHLAERHRCDSEAVALIGDRLTEMSDQRRLRRSSPCFPAYRSPMSTPDDWSGSASIPDAIDRAVAADGMLAAIAERIAIEGRLIAADPSTANFRRAMRSAQIDALATRLDEVVLEATRRGAAASSGVERDRVASRPERVSEGTSIPSAATSTSWSDVEARATGPSEARVPEAEQHRRFTRVVDWILEGGDRPW